MNKKKIAALLIAGTLTVGVVGGTFAWFTSSDSVTNKFSTGTVTDPETPGNPDAGIEIEENFPGDTTGDGKYDNPVLPGTTMTKEVSVKSTANYDQYLRAKVTKTWYYNDKVVTHYKVTTEGGKEKVEYGAPTDTVSTDWKALDSSLIVLTFDTPGTEIGNTWTIETGKYYYYNRLLGKDSAKTSALLKSVTFSSDADKYYKNLTFDVKVDAEGVQATKAAIAEWKEIPQYVKELGK